MEEFVNWDQAGPAIDPIEDLDLALANVEGDDFSFWALEHFENNVSPTLDTSAHDIVIPHHDTSPDVPFEDHFETPDVPCAHCKLAGYQCKRMREGQYRGYCTSCIALRLECSFGLCADIRPVMVDHMAIPQEDSHVEIPLGSSTPDLVNMSSASGAENNGSQPASKAKAGARFSRESVKILKNWLSTHSRHPYPNEEEKELLQRQTGLNKTQITNWLANTRRRNKNAITQRSTSPGVRQWSKPIDIPQRRGMSFEMMNPLQRWQHSPPENEPADVNAIARAINTSSSTLSSGLNSPYSLHFTDDGSGRSICDSAITSHSANTSHSSTGSFASGYSFNSRGSFGSAGSSLPRGRRRRRRKAPGMAAVPLRQELKTFQCTFCTETFRTKHDWQRHEKSLHLSLERWVCSPEGPVTLNVETGQMFCVFCGLANPDEAHIDGHNHLSCHERSLSDRTFYRKDHLRQHLKLVHDAKFLSSTMEQWKVTTPEIRSRCGFCGIIMDTWSIRVDHLAEHFKKGKSMADWKGDWGFDAPVLNMVENSIPPYLIHDERNSPDPFEASQPLTSAVNAFELFKIDLIAYIDDCREKTGQMPSDHELLNEACNLIRRADKASRPCLGSTESWLKDLILVSSQNSPSTGRSEELKSCQQLKINGKGNIFELDPMELELEVYVKARRLLGLTAMDNELQNEACNIIRRMDEASNYPTEEVVQFFMRLVNSSTSWLAAFRQRACLPRSEDIKDTYQRCKNPNLIDNTIHNPTRLEFELAEYVKDQKALGIETTDADLQRQARVLIYEKDDGWNQTAADDPRWLAAFKERHVFGNPAMQGNTPLPLTHEGLCPDLWAKSLQLQLSTNTNRYSAQGSTSSSSISSSSISPTTSMSMSMSMSTPPLQPRTKSSVPANLLCDINCYNRLATELKSFVASCVAPHNPKRHVPTDAELQHQARWIIYEDDDPWNQTAADNLEWLRRFKRDVGIPIPNDDPSLPGLPRATYSWHISQGGSGFAPPYAVPNPNKIPLNNADLLSISMRDGAKAFTTHGSTANQFIKALALDPQRNPPPATVFCSRELEKGLAEFVQTEVTNSGGAFPSDERIKEKARQLVGTEKSAADDEMLLAKFKEMMTERLGMGMGLGLGLGLGLGFEQPQQQQQQVMNFQEQQGQQELFDMSMEDMFKLGELDDVLAGMDFDFTGLGTGFEIDENFGIA
ncbi:homeobox protein 4 [Podospora fimiseda]|uniref:Homeobox protein 4 n=1 Tax=Podospora fimiseda TaxID=252190 RepID=A0AAN7BYL3_9PEZI|nr:homeobox protein 4 [Podospora fimiseda]